MQFFLSCKMGIKLFKKKKLLSAKYNTTKNNIKSAKSSEGTEIHYQLLLGVLIFYYVDGWHGTKRKKRKDRDIISTLII